MDAFQETVGGQAAEKEIVYSPFNYKNNCRIYIASDAPQPKRDKGVLTSTTSPIWFVGAPAMSKVAHLFSSQVTLTCAYYASALKDSLIRSNAPSLPRVTR